MQCSTCSLGVHMVLSIRSTLCELWPRDSGRDSSHAQSLWDWKLHWKIHPDVSSGTTVFRDPDDLYLQDYNYLSAITLTISSLHSKPHFFGGNPLANWYAMIMKMKMSCISAAAAVSTSACESMSPIYILVMYVGRLLSNYYLSNL